ncbi:hypothetical protein K443DRAFT_683197 [Laccaria amethystina LaAM-08-1]|uniref:Uncharacterized protein n=1 Tax=Laccaria amethystina LaAM-08-1 TaxID=1095629 RepID=A0A0C9XBR2_9AGAR|nr:hypothetical protein K443DRAFT_683197 [Laccaria amethystina LaAM-08-1]
MPPKGRPPKKKRNISGLRNQPSSSKVPFLPAVESTGQNADNNEDDNGGNEIKDDPSPPDMKDMASSEQEDNQVDSEFESDDEWKGLTSQELGVRLAELSCKIDDDPTNVDWIPNSLRRRKRKKKERPPSYVKGPDVMSKSLRTRRRYAESFKNQTQLDQFFDARPSTPKNVAEISQNVVGPFLASNCPSEFESVVSFVQ